MSNSRSHSRVNRDASSAVSKKVCIIGDFAVGKTSLVRRHVLNEFSPNYQATLGVNIYKFSDTIDLPNGESVLLNEIIWDIESGTLTSGKLSTYLQGAAGAVIVGDIAREKPLPPMVERARFFQEICPGRPVVFALNKVDLIADTENGEDGHALEEEFSGVAMRTSAAEGTAVQELFRHLGQRILEIGA